MALSTGKLKISFKVTNKFLIDCTSIIPDTHIKSNSLLFI